MRIKHFLAMLAVVLLVPPVAAQDGADDLMSKIINVPPPEAFAVNGLRSKPKVRKDETVQGGKALRVPVPGKGANNWDVSVNDEINKPVKAGDQLILAFWARLEKGADGATTAELPYNAVQLNKEPYSSVIVGPATITPEWKMYEVKGKADRDYAAGELNATLHLATGKHVIDLGPMFVLNMGQ